MANCPQCKMPVTYVLLKGVDIKQSGGRGTTWKGISYACPSCDCLLTVVTDPIALKTDTVDETVSEVVKHLPSLAAIRSLFRRD